MNEQFAIDVAMCFLSYGILIWNFFSNSSMAGIVKCFRPCPAWLGLGLRVRVRVRFRVRVMGWKNHPIDAQAHPSLSLIHI